MINDVGNGTRFSLGRGRFYRDFVIGLVLGDKSNAYYFGDVADVGVVNDTLGDFPVAVWAKDDRFHAYIRQVDDRTLTFRAEGETLVDEETGSTWDVARGLAVEGPLKGKSCKLCPAPRLMIGPGVIFIQTRNSIHPEFSTFPLGVARGSHHECEPLLRFCF